MWATLIVVASCLLAIVIWAGWITAHLKNLTSTPPSPTPSTTETPRSDDVTVKMIEILAASMTNSTKEMREMVVDLTQGRPPPPMTGTPETSTTSSVNPLVYDYDSTPLPAGIEAISEREQEETEQFRLMTERADLQERLVQTNAEIARFDLGTFSEPGPWQNGSTHEPEDEETSRGRHAAPDD